MRYTSLPTVMCKFGLMTAIVLPLALQDPAIAQTVADASASTRAIAEATNDKQSNIQKIPGRSQPSNPLDNQPQYPSDDHTFQSPAGDISIYMPGEVTTNRVDELSSVSNTTRTSYAILFREAPPEFSSYSPQEAQEVMGTRLMETFQADGGRVTSGTNLNIAGFPGVEAIVEFADGSTGRLQAFVIGPNMYVLAAVTSDEFTEEADQFFSSFTYYANQGQTRR